MPSSFEFVVDEPFYRGTVRGSFEFVPAVLPPSPPAPTLTPTGAYPLSADLLDASGNGRDLANLFGVAFSGGAMTAGNAGRAFDLLTGSAYTGDYFVGFRSDDNGAVLPQFATASAVIQLPGPQEGMTSVVRVRLSTEASETGRSVRVALNTFAEDHSYPVGAAASRYVSWQATGGTGTLAVDGVAVATLDLSGQTGDFTTRSQAIVAASGYFSNGIQPVFGVRNLTFVQGVVTPEQLAALIAA